MNSQGYIGMSLTLIQLEDDLLIYLLSSSFSSEIRFRTGFGQSQTAYILSSDVKLRHYSRDASYECHLTYVDICSLLCSFYFHVLGIGKIS